MAKSIEVPFVDLHRQHASIIEELNQVFAKIVEKSAFTLGSEVDSFEKEFSEYCGAKHTVGVGSGTDALHFALKACGVGHGDEVITAVNTFAATAEAIWMCAAKPVFVDMDESTFLIDTSAIEAAITEKTKAIIPVHLYGQPVNMAEVEKVAAKHGLKIIVDACQAHGAIDNGQIVGPVGDATCFSFYPGKNLGAMGDGGAVVTNSDEIAQRVKRLRNHGEQSKYNHVEPGYCSRLHSLQAALLRVKLKSLTEWNDQRIAAATTYTQGLAEADVITPAVKPDTKHVFHLYVIRVKNREKLQADLSADGVATGIHYPTPLHLEKAFAYAGYKAGDFPVAERVAKETLSLPIFPFIRQEELEVTVSAIRKHSAK
jgi:dTDP-4-amino-4,6-dideoxygalactose transaminase